MTSSSSVSLRRPLGLALSGGGALGAWQIGALAALEEGGLSFDAALGFSAGALNGAAYALGVTGKALELWGALDFRVLKLSPRLYPPSLFSDAPIREKLSYLGTDEQARASMRCPLTVVSAAADRSRPVYARFERGGRWDGRLEDHLVASCAIPLVFPRQVLPLGGAPLSLFDGGVPCKQPLSFEALADCADVLVLEMVRPEEVGAPAWHPVAEINRRSRETVVRLMGQGVASLRPRGTRVFRLRPSRPLGYSMLDFRPAGMAAARELGRRDAEAFLRSPAGVLDASTQN